MGPDLLTVIVASVSCVAFCLVILLMVVVFYSKDPLCCPFRTEHYTDDPSQYHSRHSLIGTIHHEDGTALNQGVVGPQLPGQLFIIGKPNDYHLNEPLPRLPSYESVRKKDRQRHIHHMISQRFGLNARHNEPPPTYEETFLQSLDITPVHLHSLDIPQSIHNQDNFSDLSEDTHGCSQPSTALQGPHSSSYCPEQNSRFLSI